MQLIEQIEFEQLRTDAPEFGPGDTVKVHTRVIEGGKERIQVFEGIVIGKKDGGLRSAFTVRKISHGVRRGAHVHAALAAHRQGSKSSARGAVRRAKLYYLRAKIGKAARIKERQTAR